MNEYSKKYIMLKEKKLQQILAKEKPVTMVAKEMSVSRKTIHKWLHRYKRFGEESLYSLKRKKYPPAHNRTTPEIENLVILLSEEYWHDGVETLSDRLFEEYKVHLHATTIYRILKRREVRYTHHWSGTKRRQKKQLYSHKEVGKELQVDTKYPFGYKVGMVIYTAIDDCSRWSYAKLYHTANAINTEDFLKKLQSHAPFDIQKIRTDNGTEFVNHKTINYLQTQNIEHRKNTPYCPEENGKIERFHGTLNQKSISISWKNTDSFDELQYKLSQFLQYYNYRKRHRGLGMNGLTPFQKIQDTTKSKSVTLTLQCNST
jgi:transposase InsO family protein